MPCSAPIFFCRCVNHCFDYGKVILRNLIQVIDYLFVFIAISTLLFRSVQSSLFVAASHKIFNCRVQSFGKFDSNFRIGNYRPAVNISVYGCESISEIIIPDGVEELGYSFIGGTSVKNLYVPDSVIKFGYDDGREPGDCRYNEKGNENGYIIIGKTEYESLRVPDWITEIEHIPEGTKIINFPVSLKKCYLRNSSSLEDIIIPDSLTSVSFSDGWYDSAADFSSAKLPIKTQKRLRELGYTGSFGGTRPAKKTGQ